MTKAFRIIKNILVWTVVAVAILMMVFTVVSVSTFDRSDRNLFGYRAYIVKTDSMSATDFSAGDLIFTKYTDPTQLQVGDIISYFTIIDGTRVINTHRIVEVNAENDIIQYRTQGDNKETNPEVDKLMVSPGDVIGKYNGTRIPKLGAVIDYLSTQMGFFLIILLPVLLFTIYQIYKLINVIMYNQKVDVLNAAKDTTSDEVKEAIIAEYLAKQNKEEAEDKNN